MANLKKENKKNIKGVAKVGKKEKNKTKPARGAISTLRKRDRVNSNPMKQPIEMQQIDGKVYNKYGVRSIDELLGLSTNKYSTHDIDKYEQMLNEMNTSDLQAHAVSVQILPKEDRRLLIQLLLKQFRVNNSSYLNPAEEVSGIKKKITKETLRILGEGR